MKRAAGYWLVLLLYKSVPAQTPNLVLPVGHTSSVSSVAFSPDGRFVVTASWDNTAKVWQSPEGRLLLDLKGHRGSLTSASYSNDGLFLVTTAKDSTAMIWRAGDGLLLHTLRAHRDWVNTATFSNDNRQLATASWDNTVKIWDVQSGKFKTTLKAHTGPVNTVLYSADAKYLLTSSKDSTSIVWSSEGKKIAQLKGHKDWVNAAIFGQDGKTVITASRDGTCRIWNLQTGKLLYELRGHSSSVNDVKIIPSTGSFVSAGNDGMLIVWNINDGREMLRIQAHEAPITRVRCFNNLIISAGADNAARLWRSNGEALGSLVGHEGGLIEAAFDTSGKYIATASMDNSARIWDVEKLSSTGILNGHTSVVTSAAYSGDGQYLVTASWDKTAKIWNAADGRLISNLKGHSDWINTAAFSHDGKMVVTASSDNTARVWSVPDGHLVIELKGHGDWVGSAIFSADDKFVATTSWDNTSRLFEVATGKTIATLKGHTDYVKWINLSHDGRMVVTASADNTARIWSVPSGNLMHELTGHSEKVRTAEFTSDARYVVTSSYDSTARLWDVKTGRTLKILRGHNAPLNAAMISPDDRYVTTTSMDNTARIWSLPSGELRHVLAKHNHSINSAHYSKDGKLIVLGSWDNTASIWNASNGKLLHKLSGHSGPIKSASFSPDSKFIITTSEDNTLRKWNVESGEFLYTFFAVDSSDYLAIDGLGHYDGSENARKKLYYVCGSEIVDLEQFKDLSWEPGLVSKLSGINKEPITAQPITGIKICNYTPEVRNKGIRQGIYSYEITPRNGGIGEIQLFVNDKLVQRYQPAQLQKKNEGYSLQVRQEEVSEYLVSGMNNMVLVKATTAEGLMTSRGAGQVITSNRKPSANPDMFLVSIGISEYKGEKLRLKFASKDAVDFGDAVEASASRLLNTDGKQHVFPYYINTENENSRWPLKERILSVIDTIAQRATADDLVVIFFAGHGVLQTGQKTFYLLTADASQIELTGVEKEVAISTEELKDWLTRIKANKQLLILDACNSGQVVNQMQAIVNRRSVPADQQRALESLKDRTGTFILSASASGQAAYETSIYGQGLLTYSLLSGLKFGAALRDNKFVDVTRWFNYASDNVRVMAREIGGRQDPQIIGNASFEIGIVDKDIVDRIRLSGKKQLFRSSRFIQDEDLLNDDLDMSFLVDRELNNISTGRQSPWLFVADNPLVEAYSIRGRYEIQNNNIVVKVSVFKGQKERVHQFELTGSRNKKEELAKKIVEATRTFMSQLAKSGT